MTSRDDLLRQLDEARGEFVSVLQGLDEREFETKWLDGRWGVREIVAHITGWHGLLGSALERMSRGERASPEGEDWSDTQPYNETFAEHAKGKKHDQILHELASAAESFRSSAVKLPDERFAEGSTARRIVDAAGIEHLREHTQMIRDWRRGQAPARKAS